MKHNKEPLPYLLIGTAGVEIAPFATPDPWGMIHSAQPWTPRPCSCGAVHQACSPAVVSILLGPPESGVHLDPRACGIAVSPRGRPWDSPELAKVSGPSRDFNEWALQVVKHLTAGITAPGLICFDLDDLISTVRPPRALHFSRGTSPDGVVEAARAAVESATWLNQSVRSMTIGVWGGALTTLREIGDAAALVAAYASDADAYLFTPLTDAEAVVSVLGA
jgi:hypothetical protein